MRRTTRSNSHKSPEQRTHARQTGAHDPKGLLDVTPDNRIVPGVGEIVRPVLLEGGDANDRSDDHESAQKENDY